MKEILEVFEKIIPSQNELQKEKYKKMKEFIEKLEEENIKNNDGIDITKSEAKNESNICSICADSIIDTHLLPCGHSLCRNCLFHYLSNNKICPFCRIKIDGIKEDPNLKI